MDKITESEILTHEKLIEMELKVKEDISVLFRERIRSCIDMILSEEKNQKETIDFFTKDLSDPVESSIKFGGSLHEKLRDYLKPFVNDIDNMLFDIINSARTHYELEFFRILAERCPRNEEGNIVVQFNPSCVKNKNNGEVH